MEHLVEMHLAPTARSQTPQEGLTFIEMYVLPTLEACAELKAAGKIRADGPISGAIGLALVFHTETMQELDELIESLPLWPKMEVTVTPLTTFEGRAVAVRRRVVGIKERMKLMASVNASSATA